MRHEAVVLTGDSTPREASRYHQKRGPSLISVGANTDGHANELDADEQDASAKVAGEAQALGVRLERLDEGDEAPGSCIDDAMY